MFMREYISILDVICDTSGTIEYIVKGQQSYLMHHIDTDIDIDIPRFTSLSSQIDGAKELTNLSYALPLAANFLNSLTRSGVNF